MRPRPGVSLCRVPSAQTEIKELLKWDGDAAPSPPRGVRLGLYYSQKKIQQKTKKPLPQEIALILKSLNFYAKISGSKTNLISALWTRIGPTFMEPKLSKTKTISDERVELWMWEREIPDQFLNKVLSQDYYRCSLFKTCCFGWVMSVSDTAGTSDHGRASSGCRCVSLASSGRRGAREHSPRKGEGLCKWCLGLSTPASIKIAMNVHHPAQNN